MVTLSSRGRGGSGPRRPALRNLRAAVAVGALLLAGVTVPVVSAAASTDPCTTGGNPIVCENSKPGTDPEEWDIWPGAGDASIQGYATDISVDGGDRIDFKVDTDAAEYTIDIYRTGWYQGLGARHIASVPVDVALPQSQPECMWDVTTELYDCGSWAVSAHWNVPTDATSGVYVAKLTRTDTGGASHITFVVRDDESRSDVVFQTSDPTWHAYNTYGGSDFYQGAANGRAYKVSYNRPFATRGNANGRDFYFSSEYAMVRYLEQNGYDVSYMAGVDTDRYGDLLLNHRTFLSVGHDEYWSGQQRANVEAARDAGVNLGFFSGNEVYWRTRYEPAVAGDPDPYRTLVTYKETWGYAKIDPAAEWTGTWRDPRFAGSEAGANSPENALVGTLYTTNYSDLPLTVTSAEGKLRLWRHTGLDTLADGESEPLAPHTVGYESNEDLDNGFRPEGLIRLSTTVGAVPEYLQDYGNTVRPGTTEHHTTLYRAASGALVFSAGSVQWAWGLDDEHDGDGAPPDPRMRQATMNVLADMGAQPATPAAGLVATPASSDREGPTTVVASPTPGAAVGNGTTVTVTGTASDQGGGRVAAVEVSLDGGESWHPADGRASWSYTGVVHGLGTTQIKARAVDDSANIGTAVSVAVDTACPCSVYGDAVPEVASADDAGAVELGQRFAPQVDGYVTGVRFYKGPRNTGTHTGTLWSSTGQKLAEVTFGDETPTGWQTARFKVPVPVAAGQEYVVSYSAPGGGYAILAHAFSSRGVEAYPLRVAGGFGAAPAGVFGGLGTFPQMSHQSSSYYVDALFSTTDDSPLTAYAPSPADGAVSVPPDSSVRVVLSKAVDPGSVAVALEDGAGNTVPGTTSYDPVTRTASFAPDAPLAGFADHTATVRATSTDGLPVSSGATWSFRTVRPPSDACPCGMYDETDLPTVADAGDANAVTLGMRFSADRDGEVLGARFYKSEANTGPLVASLWDGDGRMLASATVDEAVTSGWQEVRFDAPVGIQAGSTYTVAYRTESGHYSATPGGHSAPRARGHLSTPENAGAYTYGTGHPGTSVGTSYLVDVLYAPQAPAPSLSGRTPPSGAIDVATTTTIGVTASEALADGASMVLRDALGAAVPGAVSTGEDGRTATFVPSAPLSAGARYTATFSGATASSGYPLASTWSFTTAAPAGACPCTLFGSASPALEAESDGAAVELGTTIVPEQDGVVTGVRFYKGPGNGGTHTGSLWAADGTLLATTTFRDETASGWQTAAFDQPVAVTAGQTYVVSYLAPQGRYAYEAGYFSAPVTRGPLTAPVDAGRFSYGGGFPQHSWAAASYWVDAVFASDELRVAAVTPADGATDVATTSTVTARLSYGPLTGEPELQLRAGGAPVAGTSSFDTATRTVSFVPAAALPTGTTVTATAVLDGDELRSWTFTTDDAPPTAPSGAVGLWSPTDEPAVPSWDDPDAVQVGTRLRVTADGQVTGIRFYKGAQNSGTHTGYLWAGDGTLLASGTFRGESATGWQTLVFGSPVTVTAGQEMVASYYAPQGHYAVTSRALAEPRVNGPVESLEAGGTFRYGSTGFPTATSPHSFWVDVLFVPGG